MHRSFLFLALLTMTPSAEAAPPAKRPMQLDDLFALKRVADPQISPDGKHVVYQVTSVDLEGNKTSTALWLAATDGKTPPKQLTSPNGKKDMHPRWSPDGQTILFESTRPGTVRRSCSNRPAPARRSFTRSNPSPGVKRSRSRASALAPEMPSGAATGK